MTDWQPIETALRDGSRMLLGHWDHVSGKTWIFCVGRWSVGKRLSGWAAYPAQSRGIYPTHWMSQPEPPEAKPSLAPTADA